MLTSEQKILATVSHLGFLLGFPIILPIIIYALKKDDAFIAHHAKQAAVFQILSTLLIILVTIIIFIFMISHLITTSGDYYPQFYFELAILVVPIFFLLVATYAGIKTFRGNYYKYPFIQLLVNKF